MSCDGASSCGLVGRGEPLLPRDHDDVERAFRSWRVAEVVMSGPFDMDADWAVANVITLVAGLDCVYVPAVVLGRVMAKAKAVEFGYGLGDDSDWAVVAWDVPGLVGVTWADVNGVRLSDEVVVTPFWSDCVVGGS